MISNNNYNNFFKYTSIEICNSSLHSSLNRTENSLFSHSSNLPKFPKWNPSNFNGNDSLGTTDSKEQTPPCGTEEISGEDIERGAAGVD